MRKALLFVFLFVQMSVLGQTLPQVCGAPNWRKANGSVDTTQVVCPNGNQAKTCVISVSFLKCLSSIDPHPAIRINPGDTVTWYSDQKDPTDAKNSFYLISFDSEFEQKGSQDYKGCKDMSPNGDPNPFTGISNSSPATQQTKTAKPPGGTPLQPYTCFEHVVSLRDHNGNRVNIDPHVIIGDGTTYYTYLELKKDDTRKH